MAWQEVQSEAYFSSWTLKANKAASSHSAFSSAPLEIPDNHKTIWIYCGKCNHHKKVVLNCGNRLCAYCRKKVIDRGLMKRDIFKNIPKNLRFLTLTIKSVPKLDHEEVENVRNYFRKLIRRKLWKKYVKGGMYVIEATKTWKGYHIHLHVLFVGEYFPYSQLMKLWKDVTKGSYIIWINKVQNAKNALGYVLKYVSKSEKSNIPEQEYLACFKGLKLVQFFGSWCKNIKPKEPIICKHCGYDKFYTDFDLNKLNNMDWDEIQNPWQAHAPPPVPPNAISLDESDYWFTF